MRIGVVTTSYPRFAGDAAGNFIGDHVAALCAMGHDVEVVAAGDGAASSIDDGVVRVPSGLFYRGGAPDALERGGLAAVADAASFTARLAAAVSARARRWDAAIAHWLAPSALVALAAVPRRVPLVAIAHGGDVYTLARARLLRPTIALLERRGAKLAFVSAALREVARARDAIVQPMGVDLARFAAIARAPESPPIVAVIARLVPIKGVDVAIDAVDHLAHGHLAHGHLASDAQLVIAGDGPERAALERRARGKRVTFLGAIDTRARDALLARTSLVVVPSRALPNGRTEGSPLVATEALAAGVPLIASALGGLRDLPAAQLVPPDDPHALARAIDGALAAPPSPETLRASVAHFDWPLVAQRLLFQ